MKKENIKIRKNPVYSTAEEPEGPMKFAKVGKKRKYKDETDSHIEDIHYALLDALNLPEDYHL